MARIIRALSSIRKSVPVYEGGEFAKLSSIQGDFQSEARSILGEKYVQFVPFYIESKLTAIHKQFVMKMDFLPDEHCMEVWCLQLGCIFSKKIPLQQVVPVTPDEFETAHLLGKMIIPPEFMDQQMVYLDKKASEFLVFDKAGEWKEEGVNHPLLSLKERFQEHEWMDFTAGPNAEINGGVNLLNF